MKGVEPLIGGGEFVASLADHAFEADWLPEQPKVHDASPIIPAKANCKLLPEHDKKVHKRRVLTAKLFATNQ